MAFYDPTGNTPGAGVGQPGTAPPASPVQVTDPIQAAADERYDLLGGKTVQEALDQTMKQQIGLSPAVPYHRQPYNADQWFSDPMSAGLSVSNRITSLRDEVASKVSSANDAFLREYKLDWIMEDWKAKEQNLKEVEAKIYGTTMMVNGQPVHIPGYLDILGEAPPAQPTSIQQDPIETLAGTIANFVRGGDAANINNTVARIAAERQQKGFENATGAFAQRQKQAGLGLQLYGQKATDLGREVEGLKRLYLEGTRDRAATVLDTTLKAISTGAQYDLKLADFQIEQLVRSQDHEWQAKFAEKQSELQKSLMQYEQNLPANQMKLALSIVGALGAIPAMQGAKDGIDMREWASQVLTQALPTMSKESIDVLSNAAAELSSQAHDVHDRTMKEMDARSKYYEGRGLGKGSGGGSLDGGIGGGFGPFNIGNPFATPDGQTGPAPVSGRPEANFYQDNINKSVEMWAARDARDVDVKAIKSETGESDWGKIVDKYGADPELGPRVRAAQKLIADAEAKARKASASRQTTWGALNPILRAQVQSQAAVYWGTVKSALQAAGEWDKAKPAVAKGLFDIFGNMEKPLNNAILMGQIEAAYREFSEATGFDLDQIVKWTGMEKKPSAGKIGK